MIYQSLLIAIFIISLVNIEANVPQGYGYHNPPSYDYQNQARQRRPGYGQPYNQQPAQYGRGKLSINLFNSIFMSVFNILFIYFI